MTRNVFFPIATKDNEKKVNTLNSREIVKRQVMLEKSHNPPKVYPLEARTEVAPDFKGAAGAALGHSSKKRILRIIHYGRKGYNKQMRARIIVFNPSQAEILQLMSNEEKRKPNTGVSNIGIDFSLAPDW